MAAQDERGCTLQSISVAQPGTGKSGASEPSPAILVPTVEAPSAQELGAGMTLQDALRVPPVAWTSKEFEAVNKSIVAMAKRRLGEDGVGDLQAELDSHANTLRAVFTEISYKHRFRRLAMGTYDATVSYGCVQVTRQSFISIIRAPFSFAARTCDSF